MATLDLGILEGDVLLFGGPYSNLQATTAMQARANELGFSPESIICNGDAVAYCGQPEETVALLRNWGIHILMGNCEESIGNRLTDCGCGFEADTLCSTLSDQWYRFARDRVSEDDCNWMRDQE